MAKDGVRKVESNLLKGLSLSLIDGHRKGRPDGKLGSAELDGIGKVIIGVGKRNARNENNVATVYTNHDLGTNHLAS